MRETGTPHRTKAATFGFNLVSVVSDACHRRNPRRKILDFSSQADPTIATMLETQMRRPDRRIVPLVEANDVPLFLLSGRPFVVLPSLCQSLLVDLLTAKISLSPPSIFSTLQSRYRCQLFPYDTSDT